jgi:hypothetical protein
MSSMSHAPQATAPKIAHFTKSGVLIKAANVTNIVLMMLDARYRMLDPRHPASSIQHPASAPF